MLFVSIVCLSVACTPTAGSPSHPARGAATPGIAIASPKVNASWASFATGADKPHRTTADGLQISDVETGSGTVARTGDLLTVRYIMWLRDARQADSRHASGSAVKFTRGSGPDMLGRVERGPGLEVRRARRLRIP